MSGIRLFQDVPALHMKYPVHNVNNDCYIAIASIYLFDGFHLVELLFHAALQMGGEAVNPVYGYFLSYGTIPFLALHRILDELLKTTIRTRPFVDLNVFFNCTN